MGRVGRRPHRAEQAVLLRVVPEIDQPRRGGGVSRRLCRPTRSVPEISELATQIRNPVDVITESDPLRIRSGAPCVTANVIDPDCISPVAKNYLDQFIPRSATGTVVKLMPSPLDAYNFVTRVDYTLSSKNNLYGHFFKDNYERISSPGNLDYVPESNVADIKNYGVTDTHTFSSTFLNELTVSYMDADRSARRPSAFRRATWASTSTRAIWASAMSLNVGNGRMNLTFTGPERQVYRNWHWKNVMTLVRSAHTFKWGYEGQYVNFDLIRGNGARSATFTGTRSGNRDGRLHARRLRHR